MNKDRKRVVRAGQSLYEFRKTLIGTFRPSILWNPFPWAIGVYLNLCTTIYKSFVMAIVELALCFATTAIATSMPAWLFVYWLYKQVRRIYHRWWNVRFCKKCGGVFRIYKQLNGEN